MLTCINGNCSNTNITDILEVAKNIGIKESQAKKIANEIKSIVREFCILHKN